MQERQLTPPDPIYHCDCGHSVPESEMQFAFMDKNTESSVCDSCYNGWIKKESEPIVNGLFETLGEIFKDYKNGTK